MSLLSLHRLADAEVAIRKAIALEQGLLQRQDGPTLRDEIAQSQLVLGNVLLERKDAKGALAMYQASLDARKALFEADRSNVQLALAMVRSHEGVARATLALGDRPAATRVIAEARDVLDRLAHEHPDHPGIRTRRDELATWDRK